MLVRPMALFRRLNQHRYGVSFGDCLGDLFLTNWVPGWSHQALLISFLFICLNHFSGTLLFLSDLLSN